MRSSLANIKASEGEQREAVGARAEISLQPLERTAVEQVFPYSPGRGAHQSRYPHCSSWRTSCCSRWMYPERSAACGVPTQKGGPVVSREDPVRGKNVRRKEQQRGAVTN